MAKDCLRIVISNPMRTRAIASAKVKTDKVDAQVQAQLLRCDLLRFNSISARGHHQSVSLSPAR